VLRKLWRAIVVLHEFSLADFCFKLRCWTQVAGPLWAYIKFQDKCPPINPGPLGLWLDIKQMSADLAWAFGPMACFRTKVRQSCLILWAYGLI
ncbi:MAG: hypothetical protein VZQ80_09815, partial [Lachnospiraceae bacterium]|nr:hypothetical protein [Lachnospiraceae bacterium]